MTRLARFGIGTARVAAAAANIARTPMKGVAVAIATAALVIAPIRADRPQQAGSAPGAFPVPGFADPDRMAKLQRAFPEIDRLFTDFMARAHVPGAAWGIVVDGRLVHSGTAGVRDVGANAPVDLQTVFRIASMTKSFTAMAILKLRDEGWLSLDDPAERYVPELEQLRYPTSDSPRITIRHLLTHSAGFPEDNPWGDRHLDDTNDEMSRMMRSGIPFSTAPGTEYEYSNYAFGILGRIVSNVSRMPYRQYVERHILRPLGMTSTTFEPAAVPAHRLAKGYRWEDERWKDEPLLSDGAFGAMGGLLTTVPDLARYVSALLAAFPPRDEAEGGPVRRASLREMQQVWRARPAVVSKNPSTGIVQLESGGYGYGLRVSQSCAFTHSVAHGGGLPGFGSLMRWLPEYGVGIITFGNVTYTGWGGVVGSAFEALSRTGGLAPRAQRPSEALEAAKDGVSRLFAQWDDRLADRLAADNLFLDQARERRRAEFEALRSRVGSCRPAGPFDYVENALRGQWTLQCERGAVRASITLAPTMPPRVQFLQLGVAPDAAAMRPQSCPQ